MVSQPEKPDSVSRTEFSSIPWGHLSADFMGPLPSGHYLFKVVDHNACWSEVVINNLENGKKKSE